MAGPRLFLAFLQGFVKFSLRFISNFLSSSVAYVVPQEFFEDLAMKLDALWRHDMLAPDGRQVVRRWRLRYLEH